MSKVLVLDTNKQPLNPVHPGRARILLASDKAAVFKRYPFTIILKCAVEHPDVHPLRLKIDPGSQTTGMALVDDPSGEVVFAAELTHRGPTIKHALDQRRAVRRGRRQRNTRYRKPRFHNRRRRSGWLPPSLESRVLNVLTSRQAPGVALPRRSHQCRTGEVRPAAAGAARDQRHSLPAGDAGRL